MHDLRTLVGLGSQDRAAPCSHEAAMNGIGERTGQPSPDTHAAQAERIASHCERHPGRFFSAAELAAKCDLGCATKVLSAMAGPLGYGIAKAWRSGLCVGRTHTRRVRVYRVTHRPHDPQLSLFGSK